MIFIPFSIGVRSIAASMTVSPLR